MDRFSAELCRGFSQADASFEEDETRKEGGGDDGSGSSPRKELVVETRPVVESSWQRREEQEKERRFVEFSSAAYTCRFANEPFVSTRRVIRRAPRAAAALTSWLTESNKKRSSKNKTNRARAMYGAGNDDHRGARARPQV